MLVSLVIPTFNREGLLLKLLQSVVAQVHRPVEVVVVDDGSTDDMRSAVEKFFEGRSAASGLMLRYERLPARSGAPAARNRGVALASGEAVMFVDSDDLLAHDGLATLAAHLTAEPARVYAYGKVALTSGVLEPEGWSGCVGEAFQDVPADLAGYHWHTMGALYRRSALGRVGPWNEALSGSQDWEYQARVKLALGVGDFVDVLVGFWLQHEFGRIGPKSFRPDYVASVMKACDSILSHARAAGKCDSKLEQKIARRLLVHAVEWGANGHPAERKRGLRQARACLSDGGWMAALIGLWSACPSMADRFATRALQRLYGRG
jgi:glycosyltransferase involved in cell wall biosynthesis